MIYPCPIKKGDSIGLIAPSSPVSPSRLTQCIKTISDMGFAPVLGASAHQSFHGYLAGNDMVRASDINEMFQDDGINAIFCLRGGYGSTRIMDMLDYDMIRNHPKLFVGYSDITAFHLAFYSLCGFSTIHGPMVSSNMVDDFDFYTEYSFSQAVRMPETLVFQNPDDCSLYPIVKGCTSGRIIGGCLSLVAPSVGTFYQPDFTDTILFLEDVDETLPRCDKHMQQLKNSGILDQVNGVVLGNFTGCLNAFDLSYGIFDFFCDFFEGYEKPVLWGIQSGHGKPMGTIPFGTVCTLDADEERIVFEYR